MQLQLQVNHVRPINSLTFDIDLSRHSILCIVGTNGTGKTTLAKAIMNLALADTFIKTSTDGIFDSDSTIRYTIDNDTYVFTYDQALRSITTRKPIPEHYKKIVSVEMPAPHGQRFTFFRTLADQNETIRQAVVLGQYEKPKALIKFLNDIYQDRRFDELVEVKLRRGVCCCFVLPDKRYIREDYFSSGEYFLINLYRKVSQGTPLIVIDEIDVSLDTRTQAKLAQQLRDLCKQYRSTVVFTSHSLALMQTLEPDEIRYLDRDPETGTTTLQPMSFNAVKSLLFQFQGFDRYILTEDMVLTQFLEYSINRYCTPTFYTYQIIYLGGQGQAKGLMKRNVKYKFLGSKADVICVLDGDQAGKPQKQVLFIPLDDVEKALWTLYREPNFAHQWSGADKLHAKELYKQFIKTKRLSAEEIFKLLCDRHDNEMKQFAQGLANFLCRNSH